MLSIYKISYYKNWLKYIRNFLYISLKIALQIGPKHAVGIII